MKNIVKVLRFKDNAVRLYQIPTCMALERGTLVDVEFGDGTTAGVTVSGSYCGEYEEQMLRDLFNVLPEKDFKKVVAIYEKSDVTWQADEEPAEDVQEEDIPLF